MQSALRLARWEWFRLHHRIPFLVLAGLAFVIPLLSLVVRAVQQTGWLPTLGDSGYFEVAAGSLAIVSPILAIVLSSFTHANDLQNGACRTLTARGASREAVIAAKSLVAAALLLGFHLIVLVAAFLFASALDPHFSGWQAGTGSVFASWMVSLLYLGLGIALSQWQQSGSFTVGVGISIIFVEAIFYPVANGLGSLQNWPVAEVTAWTLWGISRGLQGDNGILSAAWYIPISIGYIAGLAVLGAAAFRKFDLRAGSD
ncbi:MAG: ABC transporter permease subunit [Chloroflexi bacterium]|nr:ABC transporter permease subunit [Chloroflexota bacterium]